jgi:ADP-ribose pyrophosphatase YjhB (NUDIX family)
MSSSASKHSVSVAAVITDPEQRVLVVQRRDNGNWEIPGGVLELEESIHDGLRREVEEETGLVIEPGNVTGIYKNLRLGVVALVFTARITHGEPHPTAESAAVAWWPLDEVASRMADVFATRVTDALSGRPTQVRLHDGVRILDPARN